MDRSVCLFGFISFALLGNSLSLFRREHSNCKNWMCDLRLSCIPENYTEGTDTSIYNADFTQFTDNCNSLQPDASVNCENGEFIITVANVSQFNGRYNGTWSCLHKTLEYLPVNIPYIDKLDFNKTSKRCASHCFLPEGEITWYAGGEMFGDKVKAGVCDDDTTLFSVENTFEENLFNIGIYCELFLRDADLVIRSDTEQYDEHVVLSPGAIAGIVIGCIALVAAIVFGGMFVFRVGPFKKAVSS